MSLYVRQDRWEGSEAVNLLQGRGSLDEDQNKGEDAWVCSGDLECFNYSGSEGVWWRYSCKLGWDQIAGGLQSPEK